MALTFSKVDVLANLGGGKGRSAGGGRSAEVNIEMLLVAKALYIFVG